MHKENIKPGKMFVALFFFLMSIVTTSESLAQSSVKPFHPSNVRLTEGVFKESMMVNKVVLDDIGEERALYCFRYQAGLSTNGAKPLESWASPEPHGPFPGFYEGHYLSAISLMYAQTRDPELLARVNYMVAEMGKCQDAMGGKYMFASPEIEFSADALDGVPWYRTHKIMEGLIAAYKYAGNAQALTIVEKFAEWIDEKVTSYGSKFDNVKKVEYGGMQEAFINLYEITKNPMNLEQAKKWEQKSLILDKFNEGTDFTEHANTLLAKMAGAGRVAEVEHDHFYKQACENFWNFVAGSGNKIYATGGTSIHEGLPAVNSLANSQSKMPQETCCSYNLLKLTHSLHNLTTDIKYIEYYERSLFNSILGSQNPANGWKTYYQPLNANAVKDFRSHLSGCFCCNGTGMENPVRYNSAIYSHSDSSVFINLFIGSVVDWTEKEVSLEQTTNFPYEECSELKLSLAAPVEFAMFIRVPEWCSKDFSVHLNGEAQEINALPGSYAIIRRTWNNDDIVKVTFPMEFSRFEMSNKPNQMAFLYGPLVLVGEGDNPYVGELIGDLNDEGSWVNNLNTWFQPVSEESLSFTATDDASRTYSFKPYFEIGAKQYFTGYWDVVNESKKIDDGNLALGKPVLTENPFPVGVNVENFLCAEKVTDGLYGGTDDWYTKWFPNGMAPQWVTVDLGEEYNINLVQWFASKEDYTGRKYYKYKIETSLNNSNWEMYDDRSKNDTVFEFYYAKKASLARYVKLTVLPVTIYSGDKARPKIAEIKIFEQADTTLTPKFIAPEIINTGIKNEEIGEKYTIFMPDHQVSFILDMDVVRVDMYSILGKMLLTMPVSNHARELYLTENKLSDVGSGTCVFRFYGEDNSTATRKTIRCDF
jgi:uncharacterized protein